jgi:type II secretory pathway pseudopilin PulG
MCPRIASKDADGGFRRRDAGGCGRDKRHNIGDARFAGCRAPQTAWRKAFTLVEVLAAMLFMAVVIPVAMQGLRLASLAGEVAQRKMVAVRIANKLLNELKVTGQLQNTGQGGVVQESGLSYRWSVKDEMWTEDTLVQMTLATLIVSFNAQGKSYDVRLSTLQAPQTRL